MAVPITLEAGTLISASDLNTIHDYLDSKSEQYTLGPRGTAMITAIQDASQATDSKKYVQVGWNAETYLKSPGEYKNRRFVVDPTSLMRVGHDGIQFLTTARQEGDLDSQLNVVLEIGISSYVYVPTSRHLTRVREKPTVLAGHRMTLTWLDTPTSLYSGTVQSSGAISRTAGELANIPEDAVGLQIYFQGQSAVTGGRVRFMCKNSNPTERDGFAVYGIAGSMVSAQGTVPLGIAGSSLGKFVEDRTASFTNTGCWIVGYWL